MAIFSSPQKIPSLSDRLIRCVSEGKYLLIHCVIILVDNDNDNDNDNIFIEHIYNLQMGIYL